MRSGPNRQKVKLEQLYQRRLVLTRELYEINGAIQALEKSNSWTAAARVHHVDGCTAYRGRKRTKNWKLVDCINCHKKRDRGKPPNRRPKSGEDWERTVR